jgi:hypothetical protein
MADPDAPHSFSPDRARRSYMMDVDPGDAIQVPDLGPLLAGLGAVEALERIGVEDWEPVPDDDRRVRAGTVLQSFLMVSGEVNAGGRTPCREEHLIVVAALGEGDVDPVVLCPIVSWRDFSRYRAELQGEGALRQAREGGLPGLLPTLFPCAGYDTEPNAFIRTALLQSTLRRYVVFALGTPRAPLRLREPLVPGLQAAVIRGAKRR